MRGKLPGDVIYIYIGDSERDFEPSATSQRRKRPRAVISLRESERKVKILGIWAVIVKLIMVIGLKLIV
jgi:hypothetical protein